MKLFLRNLLVLLLAGVLGNGCYPGSPDTIAQTDAVITTHDASYPFSQNRTWAMVDTVWSILYSNFDSSTNNFDAMILEEIENAMAGYGYERIDTSSTNLPDVYVTVAEMSSAVGAWALEPPYRNYCTWWAWCDNCCTKGWIPEYPEGYPSGVFAVGTLFIDIIDPSLIDDTSGIIPVKWAAIAHGVIEFNPFNAQENTRSSIRRAFAQSPFLELDEN